MIDWYDKKQCHHNERRRATTGRMGGSSRSAMAPQKPRPVDLGTMHRPATWSRLLASPNEWHVRHGLGVSCRSGAGNRTSSGDVVMGASRLPRWRSTGRPSTIRLRGLWALHAIGGSDDSCVEARLADRRPATSAPGRSSSRSRTGSPRPHSLDAVRRAGRVRPLARRPPLPRLGPPADCRSTTAGRSSKPSLAHAEDADDQNMPLDDLVRRRAAGRAPTRRGLLAGARRRRSRWSCRSPSAGSPRSARPRRSRCWSMRSARRDRRPAPARRCSRAQRGAQGPRPGRDARRAGPTSSPSCSKDADAEVRSQATALALTFGDPSALRRVPRGRGRREGRRRPPPRGARRPAEGPGPRAGADPSGPARRARPPRPGPPRPGRLRRPEDARGRPAASIPSSPPDERRDALNTLAARAEFAQALLAAVEAEPDPAGRPLGRPRSARSATTRTPTIDATIGQGLGHGPRRPRPTGPRLIAEYKAKLLAQARRRRPTSTLGRAVFAKTCQQCHTLFGTGGKVGPELTGSNRRDLDYVLSNVLDPSRPDRQGLPRPRHRHERRPGPDRDHPRRGQGRDHARHRQRDADDPQGRDRGAAGRASSR